MSGGETGRAAPRPCILAVDGGVVVDARQRRGDGGGQGVMHTLGRS